MDKIVYLSPVSLTIGSNDTAARERVRLSPRALRRATPDVNGHQFQTDGSFGGYPAQTSVLWAATPLLLKNSFAQLPQ